MSSTNIKPLALALKMPLFGRIKSYSHSCHYKDLTQVHGQLR